MRMPSHARRSRRRNTTLGARFIDLGVDIPAKPPRRNDAAGSALAHVRTMPTLTGGLTRIRRIFLPALALSGALALVGCAIQTSSDLGSISERGDFNPATEPCP